MADGVRFEIDVHEAKAFAALRVAPIAEEIAELVAREVRAGIPHSDLPAGPGEPPHSPGVYRDSWHGGKAKRTRDGSGIRANAFSLAKTSGGYSLARTLDEGLGPIAPHPHIRQAIERARAKADAILRARQRGA